MAEMKNEEIRFALKQLGAYFSIKIRDKKEGDVPVELLQRIEEIQEYVDNLPSEYRWIPCSERLPKDKRQVLVYAENVHFALAKYDEMREADGTYKKQWVTFDAWKPFYKIKNVIAWMPLPDL